MEKKELYENNLQKIIEHLESLSIENINRDLQYVVEATEKNGSFKLPENWFDEEKLQTDFAYQDKIRSTIHLISRYYMVYDEYFEKAISTKNYAMISQKFIIYKLTFHFIMEKANRENEILRSFLLNKNI